MSFYGNVLYDPNWIWDSYEGNTSGNIIGEGYATYYAKSTSSFICPDAILPTHTITNSVSMTVSQ